MSFKEKILSKDKHLCIFLKSIGGYCVLYPSNIFCKTQDLKIQLRNLSDQLHASENTGI